jgi:hypothetical protein
LFCWKLIEANNLGSAFQNHQGSRSASLHWRSKWALGPKKLAFRTSAPKLAARGSKIQKPSQSRASQISRQFDPGVLQCFLSKLCGPETPSHAQLPACRARGAGGALEWVVDSSDAASLFVKMQLFNLLKVSYKKLSELN